MTCRRSTASCSSPDLKAAAASFQNRNLRKGLNGWLFQYTTRKQAMRNLQNAGRAWINRAMMAATVEVKKHFQ